MKIMRISSGLGNQMLEYATYLQIKRQNPNEQVFLDTLIYDYREETAALTELKQVFHLNINAIDIHKIIEKKDGISFENDLAELRFWKEWGYNTYSEMFRQEGKKAGSATILSFLNYKELAELEQEHFDERVTIVSDLPYSIKEVREKLFKGELLSYGKHSVIGFFSKLWGNNRGVSYQLARALVHPERRKKLFDDFVHGRKPDFNGFPPVSRLKRSDNVYFNIYGNPNDCEGIRDELLKTFTFPAFDTEENEQLACRIKGCNSVAIHARVYDFSYGMADIVKRNYYPKAVRYIKKHVPDCRFFVFSDDPTWCRKHLEILGLSKSDSLEFVDWNKGTDS
ncbi:MAG: hypothetical protein E7211_20900, partial [Clostridium lundense]|nr:hypothetical protein [Clostridium lundense]